MLEMLSDDDLAALPSGHAAVAREVLESLRDFQMPSEPTLVAGARLDKSTLDSRQMALMAFIHSWRGDFDRAFLDAEYWMKEYACM
jgi:hypothetical protein